MSNTTASGIMSASVPSAAKVVSKKVAKAVEAVVVPVVAAPAATPAKATKAAKADFWLPDFFRPREQTRNRKSKKKHFFSS